MSDPACHDDESPLVEPGKAAGPADSMRLIAQGGAAVQQTIAITGKEKFEFMVLYCLRLLEQSNGGICAFYLEDFDDCDEHTLRVIQRLMGRSGYTCSDYADPSTKKYKGFWGWRKKEGQSPAVPSAPAQPQKPNIREF